MKLLYICLVVALAAATFAMALPKPGVNFINVFQAAFTRADPKNVKRH